MWPFKKKTTQSVDTEKTFTSVICIPGDWIDRTDFIQRIVSSTNGDYIAAGGILLNLKDNTSFLIEFCERDEKIADAFKYAGRVTRVSDDFIKEIDQHRNVVYISSETGNLDAAKKISFAANAVLSAGGIGIKIETAGKAFEKSKWIAMLENFEVPNLFEMFVLDSIADKDGTVFSCGMQNLGYKDTIVSGLEFQSAVDLISIFSYYQIIDKPTIQDKQTFSKSIDAPKFIITDENNYPYKGDELFGNPNGMWRLTNVVDEAAHNTTFAPAGRH